MMRHLRSTPVSFLAVGTMTLLSGVALLIGNSMGQVPLELPAEPTSLKSSPGFFDQSTRVKLPANLDTVIKDSGKAIALGKAFFWDQQAGSDGQACASCHFHAGADNRVTNQLNPGQRRAPIGDNVFNPTRTGTGGPNYKLKAGDFPFHVLADPLDRNSNIVFDSNDSLSSQGAFDGTFLSTFGLNHEGCAPVASIFQKNGKLTRKVEPRNTPTVINAIFQYRTFWDGRANNHFNGVSPFGRRDASAKVYEAQPNGSVALVTMDLENAALASQAVGPTLSDTEMSCGNRAFRTVGRKLLSQAPRPLYGQKVDPTDSVLGLYADSVHGLKAGVTYASLIQQAFQDKYWNAPTYTSPDGYTMMEENFSMYWGLAIMMYESTLISDDSPFDRYAEGDFSALTDNQVNGFQIFLDSRRGNCVACHKGPDFTGAGMAVQNAATRNALVEQMMMGDNLKALYDNGFYNIGVRPSSEDLGVGAEDPFGNPLSFIRQYKLRLLGHPAIDPFEVDPCVFEAISCDPVPPTVRDVADGAVKTPTLRNVELTGPYMHTGSMSTLEQVIDFYDRGGNRRGVVCDEFELLAGLPCHGSDTTSYGPNPTNLDPDIRLLHLTPDDKADLIAFLKSLTDDRVRCEQAPFDHPALRPFNGHSAFDKNNDGKLDDMVMTIPSVGAGGLPAKGLTCLKPFDAGLQ